MEFRIKTDKEAYNLEAFVKKIGQDLLVAIWGGERPHIGAVSGQTGVDNLDSIIAADRLSDELGLDTISAGVTIGFAMELFEEGILRTADTGGLELNFGNHQTMVTLLRLMAFREGVGDLLSDGVKAAAEKIGKGSNRYALHVKGLELPGYDVRGAKAHGLNYATAFNVREGFTRADDGLPERLMAEPLQSGASKGHFISKDELKQMLHEYYTVRGWDLDTGIPTRDKLMELGLGYVADQF